MPDLKGWRLVSLYTKDQMVYVHFAHYTGRQLRSGGHETDKVLSGEVSVETLRRSLRRNLVMESGNKEASDG